MRETELFEPVRAYLDHHGYEVNAEVKHCDIVASRGDELVIVELKTSANMQVLVQAVKRQQITRSVYIAVPEPADKRRFRGIQRVLRQLELGLLIVSFGTLGTRVTKVLDPLPYQKRQSNKVRRSVIQEIADRSANYNTGGSTRTALVTAYREQAIMIATALELLGTGSPKTLRAMGTGDKTPRILADNHYGWFQRVARGIYQLTDQGKQDLKRYPELHAHSRRCLESESPD